MRKKCLRRLKINKKILYLIAALAYTFLIYYLSDQARPLKELRFLLSYDKIVHCLEYSVFAFLWYKTLSGFEKMKPFVVKINLIWGGLYAASDEIHQSFVPGRHSSVFDWIADFAGIIITTYLLFYYEKRKKKVRENGESQPTF